MEVYKGKPIWYALGNFVFDQTWSEPTMEGITLELTFRGTELVQAHMRPHIILDKAQPNFLDPAGDGQVVMGQVFTRLEGPAALVGAAGASRRLDDPGEQVRLGQRRLDPRLAQDVRLVAPSRPASRRSPSSMNGLSSLIWVTCSWIAAHLASSGAPATSIQVVIDSSGTSIFAAYASNSAICSGVASSGGYQNELWPSSSHPLAPSAS